MSHNGLFNKSSSGIILIIVRPNECLFLAVAILLAVIIIIIVGALAAGVFLNYKRTGSLLPSMPKLPRYLCPSTCLHQCHMQGLG